MRVLVTGASGVFGTDVITRLHRAGDEVVAFSRRRPVAVDRPGVTFVPGDIRDADAVASAMAGCDVVAHLAWAVAPLHSAEDTHAINIGGTNNVLEAMERTGARRLVFSSSVTSYGSWPDNPLSIPEDHPLRPDPQLLYAAHKAEAEKLIEASSVDAVISRTAPVMGRHVDNIAFRLFAAPLLVAIKGEAPRWQFLHQEDCGRFHADACRSIRTGVVNLAAADVLGLDEVSELIGRPVVRVPERVVERALRFGWKYDLVEVDPASLAGLRYMPVADTTRLREEWGFRCAWTGRETLEDMARVMKRLVYVGKREVSRRRRLPWVPTEIPPDLPAADGAPLVPAAAPDVAGELDTKIDRRFATFTSSNLSEAFPGPMTPLSLELSAHALRGSSSGMAQLLALPEPLATELTARATPIFGHRVYGNVSILREMARVMPGWTPEDIDHQYLGVPLPDRRRTTVTPRATIRALRLAMKIAPVAAGFRAEVDRLVGEAAGLTLGPESLADLPDERLAARIGLLHDLVVQGWNVACTGNVFAGGLLGLAAGQMRGGLDDLDSTAAVRGVLRLADALRGGTRPGDPDFEAAVEEVLASCGHRGPNETELESAVFADRPSMLLETAARALDAPAPQMPVLVDGSRRLRLLGRVVARSMRTRERARDAVMRLTHELRLAVRERGRRMVHEGILAHAEDVFYLSFDELLDRPADAAAQVPARRSERARLAALRLPNRFTGHWEPVTDDEPSLQAGEELGGIGASAGVVRGAVRVLQDADVGELQPGEVLVAHVTGVGWTPLFAYAAAVVTDIGALISHAAVVARELGIPCVVGTGSATARLLTGQLVEVDGTAGTVRVLDAAPDRSGGG